MRAINTVAGWLPVALLLLAYSLGNAAEIEIEADGWYAWEVAAGGHGRQACCFSWQGGTARLTGCELDKAQGFSVTDECELDSDRLKIYVQIRAGQTSDIRALNAACPVRANSEIVDLGTISTDASIDWLSRQLEMQPGHSSDVLAAISMHANPAAFNSLTQLVENRSLNRELREEALFWLAQSESSQAYDYLDRLLSRR